MLNRILSSAPHWLLLAFLLAVLLVAKTETISSDRALDWIALVATAFSLWFSLRAEARAAAAEQSAEQLHRLEATHLDMQIVEGLVTQLIPLYGNATFKERLCVLLDDGRDQRTVVRAMELAIERTDERVSRRTQRIIEYRAMIMSRAARKQS